MFRIAAPFDSRLRPILLGVLLAALLLQGATALVLKTTREATESALLAPLNETLDRMQVGGEAAADIPWQVLDTRRHGGEVRMRFRLADTVDAMVRSAWLRIPEPARLELLAGSSAAVRSTYEGATHWQVYRVCRDGPTPVVISAGRLYSEIGRLDTLQAWHRAGQMVALGLLLLAVLLVARELARPLERLRHVAREARENLNWQTPPAREAWDDIIETFTATIDRLKASEAHLKQRFESSEVERLRLEDFSARIIDALPQALVAFDSAGLIVRWNPAACALPGLRAPRAGEDAQAWLSGHAAWAGWLAAFPDPSDELDVRVGEQVHHFACERIPLHDGGWLLLFHDRTPLRRLEALLAQRARLAALGETAAGLAHELRNAMGAIVGYARLVDRAGAAGAAEIAARIQAEASAMEEMLKRFLEVARPTEPRRAWLCGEDVVADTLSHYAARFEAAGIRLSWQPGRATALWCDPFWLRQALANLLENALFHVPRGGEVVVESRQVDSSWRLSVQDDGPGIEPEWRQKVLAPFVSMRPGGTGLGLALVQKIVTAHDGRVEVLESLQGGARFDLLFPLVQEPSVPRPSVGEAAFF